MRLAVAVDEAFIKKSLCGGGDNYNPKELPPETEEYEMPAEANGKMPGLQSWHYQELTYKAFGLDNFEDIPKETGKTLEYRVIYEGVSADIGANKELASDAKKGIEHLEQAQGMDEANNTMKKFLANKCLVYATLV